MPVALDGERLALVELIERVGEIGARHGVGIVDHIEDRIVGLKVRDIYEVPAAAIILPAHARAREARRHDPPEPVQGRPRPPVGLPRLRRPVVGAAARRPRRLHGRGQRAGHAARSGSSSTRAPRGSITRASPNAVYDQSLASLRRVRRAVLADRLARVHRAVVAAVADGVAAAERLRVPPGVLSRNVRTMLRGRPSATASTTAADAGGVGPPH